jgi:large subunit ribosomal protein L5e
MKGAVDGGLFVPHKPKRFPGNKSMKGKFDPKTLRRYIYGMDSISSFLLSSLTSTF